MNAALLPLLVAVPLLSAAVLVCVRSVVLDRLLMILIPAAVSACGVALIIGHATEPVIAHNIGGYVPGIAIPFVSDTLTAVMLAVTGLSTAVSGWFLIATGEDRYRFVPSLLLMLTGGVNGALLTGDLFNLFVWIEVMLLPSYALIALTGTWRRLGIGRTFILVNLVTSTILLMGVGIVYGVTGTVTMANLVGAANQPAAGLALAIVLLALAIKAGVVPVHGWLPRTYPGTSAGIMTLFAALHTKVALYAIYRVYATGYAGEPAPWLPVLVIIAVATMLVGAFSTTAERRLRGALAFQMVSGIGHILIGVIVFSQAALAAGIFYMVHHIITMGALLASSGAIEKTYGTGRYDRLSGLMRRDGWVSVVFILGFFSLIGLPPTSGLWGKVTLMLGAAGATPVLAVTLIAAVVLASIASLMGLQRLWVTVFWGPPLERYRPDDPETGRGELCTVPQDLRVSKRLALPGATMIIASIAMFVGAGVLLPIAQRAALGLIELGPYVEAVLAR